MFRQAIALFLLIAFTLKTFNGAVIVLDYYTNTAAFASHCENKALPELDCEGKCQMVKKLTEEDKKEQQNPGRKATDKSEISARHFFVRCTLYNPAVITSSPSYFHTSLSAGVLADIFHPPALV